MSLWTSLEPASTTVDAGSTATVRLRLRNTGDVVDEYRFVPVGEIAPYTTVEPPTIRLYPGTTGTVQLTFAPPRTPDATAGPNPYAVQIIPTERPEATTVPEGNLTVTPFTEMRAELVPHTVKGRFRGRPRLAVDNLGNTPLTAFVTGSDNGDQLAYEIHPANVQIQPGRAAFINTTLRPRQLIWLGHKQQRPYRLAVSRSGTTPLDIDGTYIQRGFLPRWVATLLGLLLTLALAFIALWYTAAPSFSSQATAQVTQPAGTIPTPSTTPTASPTTSAPAVATSPSASQKQSGGGTTAQNPYLNVLLLNGTTEKCADLSNSGTSGSLVVQFTCNGTASHDQRWDLDPLSKGNGPGGTDLYQVRNVADGYCIGLPGSGGAALGTPVREYSCNGTAQGNQLWWLEKRPTGFYWIRNYSSNALCLDVGGFAATGSDRADGDRLGLYTCSDTDDQGWEIVHP